MKTLCGVICISQQARERETTAQYDESMIESTLQLNSEKSSLIALNALQFDRSRSNDLIQWNAFAMFIVSYSTSRRRSFCFSAALHRSRERSVPFFSLSINPNLVKSMSGELNAEL